MKLYGNEKTVEDFKREFSAGKLSHAFIIEGERGSGRLTLSRTLASILTGERERTMTGNHPDVHELLFLERTGQIKIDDIRDIIKQAFVVPVESEYNIFIIENAQMMGQAAQNALLQIFEEPPQNTLFFLLSTDKNLLLKTLLSRARVLKTEKLSKETIRAILEERFPERADRVERVATLAQGFLGAALEIMSDDGIFEALDFVDSYMGLVSDRASVFELSKLFSPVVQKQISRQTLSLRVSYLAKALRDVVLVGFIDAPPCYFDSAHVPQKIAETMGQKRALMLFDMCSDILSRVNSLNVSCAIANLNSHFARQS
jgi:replication-associated recombination protein RarA